MKPIWTHHDIIDIEYFLILDEENSFQDDELHVRDRRFFLKAVSQDRGIEHAPIASIFHKWVQFRKSTAKDSSSSLPGNFYHEIFRFLSFFSISAGLFLGAILGFTFFTYTGSAPLNVFHFLATFIVSQIALLTLLLFSSLLRLNSQKYMASSIFYGGMVKALMGALKVIKKKFFDTLTSQAKSSFERCLGQVQGKREYGALFYWPFFIRIQLIGLGFNLGLLAVTLFKIITTDLAFGWQSTIQFSPESIHTFVRLLSTPWSWLVENGYPSLSQIEGSRMILKDGIFHLVTQDLTSWWPFLTCALIFFGLLPRLCLVIYGHVRQRQSLNNVSFDQASHDRLLQRMFTPHVTSQALPEQNETPRTLAASAFKEYDPDTPSREPSVSPTNILVLIPDDFYGACDNEMLIDILAQKGYNPLKRIHFGEDFESDQQLLKDMQAFDWSNTSGILILMEAWMPPITDFTSYLKEMRETMPPKTLIRICLLGKPDTDTVFTPAKKEDFHVWRDKITTLGDAHLRLEALVPYS